MRVANKLKPEIKAIRLKLSMGFDPRNFKTRPSNYLFQIARGLGATLEIPKNTKTYITSCLHGMEEGQTSTQ